MISRVQFKGGINAFALIKCLNLFGIILHGFHIGIAGFALLISKGKVEAAGCCFHFMGKDIFLKVGKPEGA